MSSIKLYYCDICENQIKEEKGKFHIRFTIIQGCVIKKEAEKDFCLDCFNNIDGMLNGKKRD